MARGFPADEIIRLASDEAIVKRPPAPFSSSSVPLALKPYRTVLAALSLLAEKVFVKQAPVPEVAFITFGLIHRPVIVFKRRFN